MSTARKILQALDTGFVDWPPYTDPSTPDTRTVSALSNIIDMAFDGTNIVMIDGGANPHPLDVSTGLADPVTSFNLASNTANGCTFNTDGDMCIYYTDTNEIDVHAGSTSTVNSTITVDTLPAVGGVLAFNGKDFLIYHRTTNPVSVSIVHQNGTLVRTYDLVGVDSNGGIVWADGNLVHVSTTTNTITEYIGLTNSVNTSFSSGYTGGQQKLEYGGTNLFSKHSALAFTHFHPGIAVYAGP